MSAELSGRVDALENNLTFLTQDLLQKIDLISAGNQQYQWNQQFDIIDQHVATLKTQVATLQSLYVNLFKTVKDNFTLFTGYTGSV